MLFMKPVGVHLVTNAEPQSTDSSGSENEKVEKSESSNSTKNGDDLSAEIGQEDPIVHGIYRCLLYLGDLARYRGLYCTDTNTNKISANDRVNDSQTKHRIWLIAEKFYTRASQLLPKYGNPHNQLAVISTYNEDEFSAAYRYCRSSITVVPFTSGLANLMSLFNRNKNTYKVCVNSEKAWLEQAKMKDKSSKNSVSRYRTAGNDIIINVFVTKFLRLQGLLLELHKELCKKEKLLSTARTKGNGKGGTNAHDASTEIVNSASRVAQLQMQFEELYRTVCGSFDKFEVVVIASCIQQFVAANNQRNMQYNSKSIYASILVRMVCIMMFCVQITCADGISISGSMALSTFFTLVSKSVNRLSSTVQTKKPSSSGTTSSKADGNIDTTASEYIHAVKDALWPLVSVFSDWAQNSKFNANLLRKRFQNDLKSQNRETWDSPEIRNVHTLFERMATNASRMEQHARSTVRGAFNSLYDIMLKHYPTVCAMPVAEIKALRESEKGSGAPPSASQLMVKPKGILHEYVELRGFLPLNNSIEIYLDGVDTMLNVTCLSGTKARIRRQSNVIVFMNTVVAELLKEEANLRRLEKTTGGSGSGVPTSNAKKTSSSNFPVMTSSINTATAALIKQNSEKLWTPDNAVKAKASLQLTQKPTEAPSNMKRNLSNSERQQKKERERIAKSQQLLAENASKLWTPANNLKPKTVASYASTSDVRKGREGPPIRPQSSSGMNTNDSISQNKGGVLWEPGQNSDSGRSKPPSTGNDVGPKQSKKNRNANKTTNTDTQLSGDQEVTHCTIQESESFPALRNSNPIANNDPENNFSTGVDSNAGFMGLYTNANIDLLVNEWNKDDAELDALNDITFNQAEPYQYNNANTTMSVDSLKYPDNPTHAFYPSLSNSNVLPNAPSSLEMFAQEDDDAEQEHDVQGSDNIMSISDLVDSLRKQPSGLGTLDLDDLKDDEDEVVFRPVFSRGNFVSSEALNEIEETPPPVRGGMFNGLLTATDYNVIESEKKIGNNDSVSTFHQSTLGSFSLGDLGAPPGLETPGIVPPGLGPPGLTPPDMGIPGMAPPGMGLPGLPPPGMGYFGMAPPGMAPPGMGPPGLPPPGVGYLGSGPPGLAPPGLGQAGYGLESYAQFGQNMSSSTNSAYASTLPDEDHSNEMTVERSANSSMNFLFDNT